MAQETTVRFIDDLDGSDAEGTIEFGLEGKTYEIDLSTENTERLRGALVDFIAAGRRVTRTKPGRGPKSSASRSGGSGSDREANQAIREWARENGHQVNERGRIPREVIDAYHEANA
jgi:hypothetical protein